MWYNRNILCSGEGLNAILRGWITKKKLLVRITRLLHGCLAVLKDNVEQSHPTTADDRAAATAHIKSMERHVVQSTNGREYQYLSWI